MIKTIVFLTTISFSVLAQNSANKISTSLRSELQQSSPRYLIWIYFTDKGENPENFFSNPESVISKKSIERRTKSFLKNSSIDFTDLPIYSEYIDKLISVGFELKQKSKWFNSVSGYANSATIKTISSFSFVKKLDLVKRFKRNNTNPEIQDTSKFIPKYLPKNNKINLYNYGPSYDQYALSNIPQAHDLGYNGQGVTICVMDAGFNNLAHEVFQNMNIIASYDFVNHDFNVADQSDSGDGTHGTAVLSIIGGFKEGELIGPAFGANYILAKTENTQSETPIEEDNWIAAMEWADSIGVDVTSTSLGYLDFDSTYVNYTWADMDGNTALITKAADLAVAKGIVVVNSAGNEGYNSLHNTLQAPADGDSVITVGAVDYSENRTYFSSVGPTTDGRIKPDVMAVGLNVYHAAPIGNYYFSGDGTSFSCPIVSGIVAILLSANHNLTPMEIREIFRNTSTNKNNPDNLTGWGVVDALAAINTIITDVKAERVADNYMMLTNYPNPFNPVTTIRFSVTEKGNVKITLFNTLGENIRTILNEEVNPGLKEIQFDASDLPSGIYLVNLYSNNRQKTIKIMLLK